MGPLAAGTSFLLFAVGAKNITVEGPGTIDGQGHLFNNWGQGGGILGGVVLGMLLGYEERRPERAVHHVLALICGGMTVGVLGWASLSALAIWFGF